jgi:DNA-binding protein H-NS
MRTHGEVQAMPETIDLSNTTSIEALNALIVAAEQRREELQRSNFTQLRQNLKAVAKDLGISLPELFRRLTENDNGTAVPRTRRPSDLVRAEKRAAAQKMKYYDPASGTGWSGMGRAPRAFRDKDSGLVDEAFLRACRNPDYQEWAAE